MALNARSAEFYASASWSLDKFPALNPKDFPDAASFSKLRRTEDEQLSSAKDDESVHVFWEIFPTRDDLAINVLCYEQIDRESFEKEKRPLIVAFHGGGWVLGDYSVEDNLCREVVKRFDCFAVSVHYRLSPEQRYPTPLHDCIDVIYSLVKSSAGLGFDRSRIIFVSSSAGASLACGAFQSIQKDLGPSICGLVLNIPVTCDPLHFPSERYSHRSWEEHANAPLLSAEAMSFCFDLYAPERPKDPLISPLLSPMLHRFPPTGIVCAAFDPMCDQGIALAKALEEKGVPTKLKVFENLPHGFHMIEDLPAAKEATAEMADQVQWMLERATSGVCRK